MKPSSENEIVQASQTVRSFLWGDLKVKIELFKRDWSFSANMNISCEKHEHFDRSSTRVVLFQLWARKQLSSPPASLITDRSQTGCVSARKPLHRRASFLLVSPKPQHFKRRRVQDTKATKLQKNIFSSHHFSFKGPNLERNNLAWSFQSRLKLEEDKRATTNVQNRFVQIFLLSFLLFCFSLSQNPLFWRGKSRGKNYEKVPKSAKKCEKLWNDFAL